MLTISSKALRTASAVILGIAAGGLAFVNYSLLTTPIDTSALVVTGSVPTPDGAAGKAPLALPEPPPSLSETTARPVFLAERRPIAPKAAPEEPAPVEEVSSASLQLLGTVHLGEGKVKALIRSADAADSKWIPIGDEFDGWTVSEVSSDAAVLEGNGKRVELVLSYAGGSGQRIPSSASAGEPTSPTAGRAGAP